jgi:ketosteroid isomerase-like protein
MATGSAIKIARGDAGENAAIVARAYQALNGGDVAMLAKLFDENSSWHTPGCSPVVGKPHRARQCKNAETAFFLAAAQRPRQAPKGNSAAADRVKVSGRYESLAPAARMAWRTARPL